ncbi:MAG: MFS transporter, partial [Thermoplasmata archaeon]
MRKDRLVLGLSMNIILLGIVSFLTDMSTEMIVPLLPFFLVGLGATYWLIGVIEGVAESISSFLKLAFGIYSDKLRKKKAFVISGYSISNLVKPLLALATSPMHVLAIKVTDRIGKGIRTTPRDALIADASKAQDRGKAFGLHRALDTSGAVVGPLIALIVLIAFGCAGTLNNIGIYRVIFAISAIPGIAAILVLSFVKESKKITRKKYTLSLSKFPKNFRIFVVGVGIFSLGNFSIAFFLLRSEQILSIGICGDVALYVFMNLTYALLSFPFGLVADRIGRKNILLSGFMIFSIVMLLFAFANSLAVIILGFLLFGVFMAMTDGVIRAMGSVMVPQDVCGSALGIINLITSITIFPANFIAGILWDA